MAVGFDCGTYTLVCCTKEKDFNFKKEINAFIEIPLEDRFMFNMMKMAGVPLVERGKTGYAMGEAAVKIAYTMNQLELKRPMREGCVNSKEKEAYEILKIMLHGLLDGCVKADNEVLYYSVPANALNEETDADFHLKMLEAMFNAYSSDEEFKVKPFPINEALAIVYSEAKDKNFTAIACSFGAGMVNVCFSMFGVPVFAFALVNSGDWIDKMAAKASGESSTFINQEKMKVSLNKPPQSLVERAIQTQYRIMVEKTIGGIKKGIEDAGKKARSDKPIDIIIAGGTSSPEGFDDLFREVVKQAELPINIGEVIRPKDPLLCVARGCQIAADNATKG